MGINVLYPRRVNSFHLLPNSKVWGYLTTCKPAALPLCQLSVFSAIIGGMWIRFVLYGLGGWCGEIVYTALTESLPRRDWRLTGTTYLWMFPIYGSIVFLYEPLYDFIRGYPWWVRALIWSLGFTAVEFISGWLIDRLSGQCPWDYVAAGKRYAINPYIRWDYFIVWAIIGLALEPVSDFLIRLTPAIEAALITG